MRKLLVRCQPHITMVIIIKWYRRKHGVTGVVELWRLDVNGNPRKEQNTDIFPTPTGSQPPIILLTRQDLFRQALLPGRSPSDIFTLSLDDLRAKARMALEKQSLTAL